MATTLKALPGDLEKKVLVSTSNFDVYCAAHLRMAHNETAKQGSITISIKADIANFGGKLQVLRLIVPPERIEECALKWNSNDDLLPSRLVEAHPARPRKKSEILTLSLKLNLPGIVLCPSETETLRPATPEDLEFQSFAKISRSKSFCLHFSKRQFVNAQLEWLKTCISAFSAKRLWLEPFDHSRQRGIERDWTVFDLPLEPPPYDEEPPPYHGNAASERWVRKRRREPGSLSPSNDESRKIRLLASPQPIDSPTEVNTPSTLSASPASIRPTRFTSVSSRAEAEHKVVAHLEHGLRDISDDTIRRILTRLGRKHLLVPPNDRERDLPSEVENVSLGAVEMAERRLRRYVDEVFKWRLQPLVDDIMADCLDQLRDEVRQHEGEFDDHVDDSKCEISLTATGCVSDIIEETQKSMLKLDEQTQQCLNNIEDRAAEVFGSKCTNARRCSI